MQTKEKREISLLVENGGASDRKNTLNRRFRPKGKLEIRIGENYTTGGAMASERFTLPSNLEGKVFLRKFRKQANTAAWKCATDLAHAFEKGLGEPDSVKRERLAYFSEEKSTTFMGEEQRAKIDTKDLEVVLKEVTERLQRPDLYDVSASFSLEIVDRHYLNTEGSKVFTSSLNSLFWLSVSVLTPDNIIIPLFWRAYGDDALRIPSRDRLMEIGEQLTKTVLEIAQAPLQKNGLYPVILSPESHGVLWHEVVGHPLEADHMKEDEEDEEETTHTFEEKIGDRIAPEFITLYDDPTLKEVYGKKCNGSYDIDEEGIPAQKVTLVKDGILKDYLHSRESAGFFGVHSNGHARAEGDKVPKPRMGNLVIESSNSVSYEELKERLIKTCRDQNFEYGLIFKGSEGGNTYTGQCLANTYPTHIFQLWPDGTEKRVRGIHSVGTPHQTLQNITLTSNEYEVNNGFCGSTSGWVPVSEIAPHAFLGNLEVNRVSRKLLPTVKRKVI